MPIVTYKEFVQDTTRMFEKAVELAYKDLLEKAVAEAVAAEREACAKVCEQEWSTHGWAQAGIATAAIRARSKT